MIIIVGGGGGGRGGAAAVAAAVVAAVVAAVAAAAAGAGNCAGAGAVAVAVVARCRCRRRRRCCWCILYIVIMLLCYYVIMLLLCYYYVIMLLCYYVIMLFTIAASSLSILLPLQIRIERSTCWSFQARKDRKAETQHFPNRDSRPIAILVCVPCRASMTFGTSPSPPSERRGFECTISDLGNLRSVNCDSLHGAFKCIQSHIIPY